VVEAHVALCDNEIIECGGHGLGDGDRLDTNLYWATSGGFHGWFARRGSGWRRVYHHAEPARDDQPDVLAVEVWHRRVTPGPVWRRRGVTRPFDLYVVGHAWRGASIDNALAAYVADLFGNAPRPITLDDGRRIEAGGTSQLVAYVGHNRWMDRPDFDWSPAARVDAGAPPKGAIAVACMSAAYLRPHVASPAQVPLLLTRDFLFAGAHSFEGAVRAFADGGSLDAIRRAAAAAYAAGERKPYARVQAAFTNPSDRRW
jgi:hypothetical protein